MKVLLDECVTHDLRPLLTGHDVYTVAFMGWTGTRNGALLRLAGDHSFHALITTDAAIAGQHDTARLPLPIVILHARTNRIQDIAPLVPACLKLLAGPLGIDFHHVR